MLQYACPACRSLNEAPEDQAGSKIACKVCGQNLRVPQPAPVKTLLGQLVTDSQPPPAPQPASEKPPDPAEKKISLRCPSCGRSFRVKEKYLGRQANCPACGVPILLSQATAPPPPAQPVMSASQSSQLVFVPAVAAPPPSWNMLGAFRISSTTTAIFALLLFCLPWMDLRCTPETQSPSMAKQSGLQAIYGGCSLHPVLERLKLLAEAQADLQDDAVRAAVADLDRNLGRNRPRKSAEEWANELNHRGRITGKDLFVIHAAPWLALYPILLLAAVAAGLLVRDATQRLGIVVCCCGASFLLMLIQSAVGFPLDSQWNAAVRGLVQGAEVPAAPLVLLGYTSYTAWFWLALALNIVAPGLVFGERWLARRYNLPVRPFSLGGSSVSLWANSSAVVSPAPPAAILSTLPTSPSGLIPIGDCPFCKRPVQVTPELVGRWIDCPHCGKGFAALLESRAGTENYPAVARAWPVTPAGLGCVALILVCLGVSIAALVIVWNRTPTTWPEVTFDAGFTVRMPAKPRTEAPRAPLSLRDSGTTLRLRTDRLHVPGSELQYVVCQSFDLPDELARDLPRARTESRADLTDLLAEGLTDGARGEIVQDKSYNSPDGMLREVVMKLPDDRLRARLYVVGRHLVLLGVLGSKEAINSKEAQDFFDSFQIIHTRN